jgi:hypothetical protein
MGFAKPLLFVGFLLCVVSFAYAGYSETDATEFAYASALAYCKPDDITSFTCGENCDKLKGYKSYFSQVFNVADGQTLSFSMIYNPSTQRFITTFRGTITDMQLLLEALKGGAVSYTIYNVKNGLVDNYFYTNYVRTIRKVFLQKLKEARTTFRNYKFIFTGHSLGGALATIAAFDAVTSYNLPAQQAILYNFGSPRVGNFELASAIEKAVPQIYRLVHWRDLVPHLPTCIRDLFGACTQGADRKGLFRGIPALWHAWHVSQQIFYNEDFTSYQVCTGEQKNCADQFTALTADVADHHHYLGIYMECNGVSAISQ